MALMSAATAVSVDTASVPSHAGVQPPESRTNARLNSFSPESAMIEPMAGGSLSSGIRYAGWVKPVVANGGGVGLVGGGVGVVVVPAGPVRFTSSASYV